MSESGFTGLPELNRINPHPPVLSLNPENLLNPVNPDSDSFKLFTIHLID